jgi:hypothetical protein
MNIASSTPANTVKRDYWLPIFMIVLIAVAYSPVIVISAIWEMAVQAIGGPERGQSTNLDKLQPHFDRRLSPLSRSRLSALISRWYPSKRGECPF